MFNFIYCYGVYFDIIRFIELQCLIFLIFFLLEIKIRIQYYVCSILLLIEFEFTLLFILSSLRASFFSARTMALFYLYYCQRWNFFIKKLTTLSPISVTCCSDRCHHWTFKPQPFYFRHLAGGKVTAVR